MTRFKPTKRDAPLEIGRELSRQVARDVAAETAVALSYNGVAHVVMFMSPLDVADFVTGFSLSEGIIDRAEDILSLEIVESAQGLLAQTEISKENFERVLARRRNLPGQSGCGICGVIELEEAMRALPKVGAEVSVPQEVIFKALSALRGEQVLNALTRSVHGAAFVSTEGDILALREDIGRHNALDKLIGHLARKGIAPQAGFLLLTSRCSVELVQKAVVAGFGLMVTVSAPTGLALEMARAAGLALACVAREDSMLIYNNPGERVIC